MQRRKKRRFHGTMGRPKPVKPMRVACNATASYCGRSLVEALQKVGHTVVAFAEPGEEVPMNVDSYVMEPFTDGFVTKILEVIS